MRFGNILTFFEKRVMIEFFMEYKMRNRLSLFIFIITVIFLIIFAGCDNEAVPEPVIDPETGEKKEPVTATTIFNFDEVDSPPIEDTRLIGFWYMDKVALLEISENGIALSEGWNILSKYKNKVMEIDGNSLTIVDESNFQQKIYYELSDDGYYLNVSIPAFEVDYVFINLEKSPYIFVSTEGDDNNDGTITRPFKTINRAIGEVVTTEGNKNIINVKSGVYKELINITTSIPITISGGYTSTFLYQDMYNKSIITERDDESASFRTSSLKNARIVTQSNSDVTLNNLRIEGARTGLPDSTPYHPDRCGVLIAGKATIVDCDIYGAFFNERVELSNGGVYNYDAFIVNRAYGLYIDYSGIVNIKNGSITVGSAAEVSLEAMGSQFYGIYNNEGSVTIDGTSINTITTNISKITLTSGSIRLYGINNIGGKLTMKRGYISGGSIEDSRSCGIYNIEGEVRIEGGFVYGSDKSRINGIYSAGIYSYNGIVTLSNCFVYGAAISNGSFNSLYEIYKASVTTIITKGTGAVVHYAEDDPLYIPVSPTNPNGGIWTE